MKIKSISRWSLLGFLVIALAMPVFTQEAAKEEVKKEAASVEKAAEATPAPKAEVKPMADNVAAYSLDNMMLFLAAVLVLFMQPGFALVEAGLNATKNTVNIMFKNLIDLAIGALVFWLIGYKLMYPGADFAGGFFGFGGFFANTESPATAPGALHPQIDFLFQVAFAATAATIVSGSVAGRIKFSVYLIYSALITAFIYPISGMWKWGGGWLQAMGFADFAGSLVVHTVGGFAGLAGAIVLGPRIGKFKPDGTPNVLAGSNLGFATLGVFILLVGWYGFNPGSQLKFYGSENIAAVGLIAVNTTLAATAGAVIAMFANWILFGKPELSMTLNGMLAGLVAITAGCDQVTNGESIIIGSIAGVLVIGGVVLLNKLKIDDPVGAWPVHGLNGLWGGLATGVFGATATVGTQIIGSLTIAAWSFVAMIIIFKVLDMTMGIRVSREEELKGLDISEHGEEAYKGFQIFTVE